MKNKSHSGGILQRAGSRFCTDWKFSKGMFFHRKMLIHQTQAFSSRKGQLQWKSVCQWKSAQAPASLPEALGCTDGKPKHPKTKNKRSDMEIRPWKAHQLLLPASYIFKISHSNSVHLEGCWAGRGGFRVMKRQMPLIPRARIPTALPPLPARTTELCL